MLYISALHFDICSEVADTASQAVRIAFGEMKAQSCIIESVSKLEFCN